MSTGVFGYIPEETVGKGTGYRMGLESVPIRVISEELSNALEPATCFRTKARNSALPWIDLPWGPVHVLRGHYRNASTPWPARQSHNSSGADFRTAPTGVELKHAKVEKQRQYQTGDQGFAADES